MSETSVNFPERAQFFGMDELRLRHFQLLYGFFDRWKGKAVQQKSQERGYYEVNCKDTTRLQDERTTIQFDRKLLERRR